MSTTKAAVEEGVVPGGGVALLRAQDKVLDMAKTLDGDEATGARTVARALEEASLDELIDDPEAWSAVLTTMRQHMPELASYMERGVGRKGHGATTLRQMLSLLPGADELIPALKGALAALGRQGRDT